MSGFGARQLPSQLKEYYVKAKGVPSDFTQWVINPMGGQSIIYPDEIVKFDVNLTQGYMDPWNSYFDIQVNTDIPCGLMQIDTSAFSTVDQSLISSYSAQLQRIVKYDEYGAILLQLQYYPLFSAGKQYMGLGRNYFSTTFKSNNNAMTSASNSLSVVTNGTNSATFADYGTSLFNPYTIGVTPATIGSQNVGFMSTNSNEKTYKKGLFSKMVEQEANGPTIPLSLANAVGNVTSFVSQLNASLYIQSIFQQTRQMKGGIVLPRVDYSLPTLDQRFIDTKTSKVRSYLTGSLPNNQLITSFQPTKPQIPYVLKPFDNIPVKYYDPAVTAANTGRMFSVQNTCGLHGYLNAYSPQLSIGLEQPFISPTVPQCGMKNGKILDYWQAVSKMNFIVPFLSAIMGCTIPQQSYSLLPLISLRVMIQLTLSKYAMFSSGYNDRNQFDTAGMKYPIPRRFWYTKYNYVLQVYYFQSAAMKQYMASVIQRGIKLHSQGLMLTASYMLANQLQLRGAWQINAPNCMVSEVIVRFLDASYLRYPFLRKQFALSLNVSSMQFRYDIKWYPPQPIVGNAGNPYTLDSTGNCNPFIMSLRRSRDLVFTHLPQGITNNINFCINGRLWDYTNTNSLFPSQSTIQTQFTTRVIYQDGQLNTGTSMGAPHYHQNASVGRALYIYSFQNIAHSPQTVNGLLVGSSRPFEVIFNTTVDEPFMKQIAMNIWIRYAQNVQYTPYGIRVSLVGYN